jgi:4-amino-4-deoxy-L-arabinose transferase-like glycosyltransferase
MGKRLAGERVGLLSLVVLSLSFQFISNARYTSPEAPFTFFITLTLFLWLKGYSEGKDRYIYGAFLASSMAVLTKGPAGYILPAMVVFIYLLLIDRREILRVKYYIGTLGVFLLSGWWFVYQFLENRDEFLSVFVKENIKRVYGLQEDPIYFYLIDINVSFLPYSFLIFPAMLWLVRKGEKSLLFPSVWFLSILLLFSLVKMKIPVYIMPAFPAMSMIVASFLLSEELRSFKAYASYILGVLLFITTAVGGYLFKMNVIILLLILLALLVVIKRGWFYFAPAVGGGGLLLYISLVILPFVEEHRP